MLAMPAAPRLVHRLAVTALALATAAPAQDPVLAGRVRTAAGEAAAAATLQLRWRAGPELPGLCGMALGDRGVEQLTATADAHGAFRLALPHRGPFEVTAIAGDTRSTPLFPVMAGAFLELATAPPVVVGGTLIDREGNPAAGVAVSLVPLDLAWEKFGVYRVPEARAGTTTDAEGRFQLVFDDAYARCRRWEPFMMFDFDVDGLVAGRHELLRPTTHCRELRVQLVPPEGADPRVARAPKKPVPLPPGPPSLLRARLLRDGKPLAGAAVLWSQVATRAATDRAPTKLPPVEAIAHCDGEGRVELAGIPAETTVLGFVRVDGVWRSFVRRHTAAADGETALGDIETATATRAVQGQVRDAQGQPVAAARIAALPVDEILDEVPYVTYSDHGGRFELPALPAMPYRLWADCGTSGIAATGVDAAATRAELRTPGEAVVDGEVVDVDGARVPGAWVVLVRNDKDPAAMPGIVRGSTSVAVLADAEGRVHFTGMPAGAWTVRVNAIRDGRLWAGGGDVATGGSFLAVIKQIPE
ncbi:MAG: carboxypeptidase-like regulatory domain-containing protein [Planctomycetota bacterium]